MPKEKTDSIHRLCVSWRHFKRKYQIKYLYLNTLKHYFKKEMSYELNLDNPTSFNEKLQWLMVYYRDPIMSRCVDKVSVRTYVADQVGPEYLVPVYGIYDKAEDVNFDELPNQYVLKPSHSSGKFVICTDNSGLDKQGTRELLRKWLRENYYYWSGEWVYKDIVPKIICEKLLAHNIADYKFFCFAGVPRYLFICEDRQMGTNITPYDMDFNPLPFTIGGHSHGEGHSMPENFDVMVNLVKKLSQPFPFVRVDLYNVEGRIYFSELTFFPANGRAPYVPMEWDYRIGKMLDLKEINDEYIQKN